MQNIKRPTREVHGTRSRRGRPCRRRGGEHGPQGGRPRLAQLAAQPAPSPGSEAGCLGSSEGGAASASARGPQWSLRPGAGGGAEGIRCRKNQEKRPAFRGPLRSRPFSAKGRERASPPSSLQLSSSLGNTTRTQKNTGGCKANPRVAASASQRHPLPPTPLGLPRKHRLRPAPSAARARSVPCPSVASDPVPPSASCCGRLRCHAS